jgi:hypothetical protein
MTNNIPIGLTNTQIIRPLDYNAVYNYQFTTETLFDLSLVNDTETVNIGLFCDCSYVAQIGGDNQTPWFDIQVIGGNSPVMLGVTGPTGGTPQIAIGNVLTGVATSANVYLSGTVTNPILNFTLPVGNSQWGNTNQTDIYFSNGNVAIGKNSSSYTLDIQGNLNVSQSVFATYFVNTSDYRIKENPILLDASYNVDRLRPLKYRNLLINKDDLGFLAHEVQEVYPFLVEGNKDEEKKQSLNYIGLIAILVKEVQELKKENVALKLAMEEQASLFDTRLQAIESTFFR